MGKKWLAAVLAVLLLCGCAPREAQTTLFLMDTVMDLQLWGREAGEAAAELEALLEELDRRWSPTGEDSYLTALDRGDPVPEAARQVLDKALALSQRTGGAFDPRLRRVTEAWGFFSGEYRVPEPEEIRAALAGDPAWDLGAVIKGYAGQQAAELLQEKKVDRALLNLGGNIQTYGEKPDGSPWRIGIQDPAGGGYVGTVAVTGTAAVVTSGDYQRYFEENGVRYHHIMDPKTGCPAASGLTSVTVICRDGMTADALSTGLFVLGLEEGARLWRESEDFEAVFLLADGRIFATQGAGLSGCEFEVIRR